MRKAATLITGLAIFLGMVVSAGAYSITYNHDLGSNGNDYYSPYTNTPVPAPTVLNLQLRDFDSNNSLGTLTGNYAIVSGLTVNHNAPPYGLNQVDKTYYLSVPNDVNINPVSATLAFGKTYDYLGLWWGSFDAYNSLTFINKGVNVLTLSGNQLPPPSIANGAQTNSSSNQYVNFYGTDFDAIKFTSTRYAFEVDNIAVGNVVPEPGTMVLLGFGMLGLAIYGKRRMNKEA